MRTLLLCIAVAIASCAGTFGAYVLCVTAYDAIRRPPRQPMPFSDLLAMIDDGLVEEIRVEDQIYRFRYKDSSGRVITVESIGPVADKAELEILRPTRPDLPAPKIISE
jgi:hypothetical protein